MGKNWRVYNRPTDCDKAAQELGVSRVVVQCMKNRGIAEEEMHRYLYATTDDLYDPLRMKGMAEAVTLIEELPEGTKIAVASDYDCDGIFSAYILEQGLDRLGYEVKIYTPDRVREGYGLNERIVREAKEEGFGCLITCDNGIAANEAIGMAKQLGLTVLVTDHHEPQEELPGADGILDPKQEGETYPYSGLCGAGVAFKLIGALYESAGIGARESLSLLEYVAIATVADVMELTDENRILVRYGLQALKNSENIGLRALIREQGLEDKNITAGHIGFIIGPCFNAAGRISTVEESFALLHAETKEEAETCAKRLKAVNDERKQMTEDGAKEAFLQIEKEFPDAGNPLTGEEGECAIDDVLVLYLPGVHESLVGIIAGRVKERYNHPVIVFTDAGDEADSEDDQKLIKGSGRSIPAYHMFRELMACKDLMVHFGGHAMAAGMTIRKNDLFSLRERLNSASSLVKEDFVPKLMIDVVMPVSHVSERTVEDFTKMEPFGVGNSGPLFADRGYRIVKAKRIGQEKQHLLLQVAGGDGIIMDGIRFGAADAFDEFVIRNFGEDELAGMYAGKPGKARISIAYKPEINEYRGKRSVRMSIEDWEKEDVYGN